MLVFAIVLVLGVALGLSRGGSLRNLARARLNFGWLIIAAAGLQLGADSLPGDADAFAFAMVIGSYAALGVFAWRNWRVPGIWMVALGAALNFLVIALNGGMPISERAARIAGYTGPAEALLMRGKHILDSAGGVKLRWLSDQIPLWRQPSVASIGDLILWAGIVILIADLVRGPRGRHEGATPGSRAFDPAP